MCVCVCVHTTGVSVYTCVCVSVHMHMGCGWGTVWVHCGVCVFTLSMYVHCICLNSPMYLCSHMFLLVTPPGMGLCLPFIANTVVLVQPTRLHRQTCPFTCEHTKGGTATAMPSWSYIHTSSSAVFWFCILGFNWFTSCTVCGSSISFDHDCTIAVTRASRSGTKQRVGHIALGPGHY